MIRLRTERRKKPAKQDVAEDQPLHLCTMLSALSDDRLPFPADSK